MMSSTGHMSTLMGARGLVRRFAVLAGYFIVAISALGLGPSAATESVAEEVSGATPRPPSGRVGEVSAQAVERTVFDLFASDSFIGGALVDYTEQWCEVDDPRNILEQVPNLRKGGFDELLPLVMGRIEGRRALEGLGEVSCDIFNFRLVVKFDPRFVEGVSRDVSKRLPRPEGGFSFQQNVAVAATGEFNGETDSAVSHRSVMGAGRFFGRVNGAAIEGEAYEMTEASAFGYVGDYEVGGGFLETVGQAFANSLQYTGLQIRTSDKLLLNPEEGRGSKLEVFIPSRSRVEFYRSGRLLSVQLLDFGLREVDTSAFPQGSYDVDVVITDSTGSVTRERKFFTKSGYLSVRGRPSYNFELGALREEFDTDDVPVYQAGVQWRAADALDLYGSAYGTDSLTISQIGFTALYGESYLFGSSSFSNDGDIGVNGNLTTVISRISFSLSGAKSIEVSENSRELTVVPTPAPGEPPDFIPNTPRTRELFFQDRSSYSVSARRSFGRVDLSYSLQGENFAGSDDRRSRGPMFQYNILNGSLHNLRFTASFYQTEDGDVQNNALNYRYRLSPEWSFGAQLAFTSRDEYDEMVGYLSANYFERTRTEYASRAEFSSEARDRRGNQSENGGVYTNQLAVDYGGDYLYGRGFVRDQAGSSAGKSSYGVTAESAIVLSNEGTAAVSYPMAQEAVLIANIKGVSPDTRFEVMVNDQVYDTVTVGSRAAISLTPFKTYRVGIRPENPDEFVDYDTTTYSLTVFPGNVLERSWEVASVSIVLGRVLSEAGEPIALRRLQGTREFVATDDRGFFQAELVGDEDLFVETKVGRCRLQNTPFDRTEYVVDVGDLICRSVEAESNLVDRAD